MENFLGYPCTADKAMNVDGQPFGEEIGCVIHSSNQLSQQKPEIEMGWSPAYNCVYPLESHRQPTWFLRMLYHQKHCQHGLNWTDTGQNEGSLLDFWESACRKWGAQ